MDERFLEYYNRELQHIREVGGEFAREFPKIAGRLGIDGFECADPYVERLMEGFAFMASRIQLKIDAEFPQFTQHLLDVVFPNYLSPTPSMGVVNLAPNMAQGNLVDGFVLPRHSVLRSQRGKGEQTVCEYRTAHDVTIWPVELVEAEYFTRDSVSIDLPDFKETRSVLRWRLRTASGVKWSDLPLDSLTFYLHGEGAKPMRIYEQLLANAIAVAVRPVSRQSGWDKVSPPSVLQQRGFAEDEALLPPGPKSFEGYRLLDEYFTLPERFMFVDLCDLQSTIAQCDEDEIEIVVLFDRNEASLDGMVDRSDFSLYCTPVINLFPRRCDRLHISNRQVEHHVVPDRSRPFDFEVFSILSAIGYGAGDVEQPFDPFYAITDHNADGGGQAYYSVRRAKRLASIREQQSGMRASYSGSDMFVALVDEKELPYRSDLRQLGIRALCTNRDLPLQMPVGVGKTDFTLVASAPVDSIRLLAGPTRPMPSRVQDDGNTTWRVVSHMALNYLSLVDEDRRQGAFALREMLGLYGDRRKAAINKQIEGVRSIAAEPVVRPIRTTGPLSFGRGLEVSLLFDESAFEGTGVFLLGAVLERFFGKYASINSFTQTVVQTVERGEIKRWPARSGLRQIL